MIHWSYVLLFKLFPCKAFADCLSSLFPTLHFCSHLVPGTAMIVINVSFSLTITVFGLERALAKRTIAVFGEFWHVYFLHYIFYMYIMIMLPGMHVHVFPLYTVYVLLCTLQNKSACVFIGLLLDIWCCINILRSLLYARTLHAHCIRLDWCDCQCISTHALIIWANRLHFTWSWFLDFVFISNMQPEHLWFYHTYTIQY